MGIGLQGAYGLAGANDALEQIVAARAAERMYADKMRQQEFENNLRMRQMDENSMFRQQQAADLAHERQQNQAHTVVGEMSPNQSIDEPTAGILRAAGRGSLIQTNPEAAGQGFVLSGSQTYQPGSQPGMVFTGTAAQRNTQADNDRAAQVFDANERYRAGQMEAQAAKDANAQQFQQQQFAETMRHNRASEATAQQNANTAAQKSQPQAAQGPTPYSQERTARTLQSIDELSNKIGAGNTGMGSLLSYIPGSAARDFAAELKTLQANIAFSELAAMREASKTGGALGAVSQREMDLLSSALGALDPGQSPQNLKAQLQKIKDSIGRWQAATGQAPAAAAPAQTPAAKPDAMALIKKYGG